MTSEARPAPDWRGAIVLQLALAAFVGFVVMVVWGATGRGYFWPVWPWFGLGIVLAFQLAAYYAIRAPAGRRRALALHGSMSAVVGAIIVTVWALTGGGTFWPLWSLLPIGAVLGVHAIVFGLWNRIHPERERQLVARVDELTRTRRGALDVQAAELRRIERDLHDGAQARLVSLSMQLGRAEERLGDRPDVAELLRGARDEAGAAIRELRDLARGIAPPVLADRGLVAAAESLGRRAPMPVTVQALVAERPPPVVETAAYFVVAEALTNAAKHSGGASAHVELTGDGKWLMIEVSDAGPGGADPDGSGLSGLRNRVEALDGSLVVTSPAGGGTLIRAELPCVS